MRAFGVGCFHFSIKDNIEHEITIQNYIDEVVKTLKKLTTASDVIVSFDEDIKDEKIDTTPPNPRIRSGESCYPDIPFLNFSFKLYIPSRIQAELIGLSEQHLDTTTENFKITIQHEWHGPVSYVECLSAREDCDPSTAVQVVREYLEKEILKIESFLEYDFLGPSPFHAKFYLRKNSKNQTSEHPKFELNEIKTTAYNILNFEYNPEIFDSEEQATEILKQTLADEISFFYELNKDANFSHKKWMEIQETTYSILEHEEHKTKINLGSVRKVLSQAPHSAGQ